MKLKVTIEGKYEDEKNIVKVICAILTAEQEYS